MKKLITVLCLLVGAQLLHAQHSTPQRPRLVVGVVVDQMRMDYLYRYWDKFGDQGFRKMITHGYLCRNAHFNYVPTYTGPGHASVYTGATPMHHGIIANNWFNPETGKSTYCVNDLKVSPVGTTNEKSKNSPANMLVPTIGDALRTASLFKGKSIGISIKDRSAVLPIGHSGNAAYWMENQSGHMVSSTYYMDELPKWVKQYNAQKQPDKLSKDGWQSLLALNQYTESTADRSPYEASLAKDVPSVFPYDLNKLIKAEGYTAFAASPFSNTMLRLFAEQAIVNEELGMDEHTDLLAISFSQPDLIGHSHGPQSVEVEDSYLRLDMEMAELIALLNLRVGEGNYVIFLTADHAAAQVPQYLMDNRIPAGYLDDEALEKGLSDHLNQSLGLENAMLSYSNQQVFFNVPLFREKGIDMKGAEDATKAYLKTVPGVMKAYSGSDIVALSSVDVMANLMLKGWHHKRSGQVMVQYLPGWMEYDKQGTTHGTSYSYDTHVPLIFYGFGVRAGESTDRVEITQIAPTISLLCRIAFPDASDQRPVNVFKP